MELGYFLYPCRNHQITPLIQEKVDIRVEDCTGMVVRPKDKKAMAIVWYKLEAGNTQEDMGIKTYQRVAKELMVHWNSYISSRVLEEELPGSEVEL